MSPNRKIFSIEITQMIDTMLLKGVQRLKLNYNLFGVVR